MTKPGPGTAGEFPPRTWWLRSDGRGDRSSFWGPASWAFHLAREGQQGCSSQPDPPGPSGPRETGVGRAEGWQEDPPFSAVPQGRQAAWPLLPATRDNTTGEVRGEKS